MNEADLKPEVPFVWPEPRVLDGLRDYDREPPFAGLAGAADSVFGIVSSITDTGIGLLESWLADKPSFQARLVVTAYPTCLTTNHHLELLRVLTIRYPKELDIRIKPCRNVGDRATNALCFLAGSGVQHIVTGPTENLGFEPLPEGAVNFVFRGDSALIESFSRYFSWLWARSRPISASGVTTIPRLVLGLGSNEGARSWQAYLDTCSGVSLAPADLAIDTANVDPETGDVTLVSQGKDVLSPAEAIGLAKLDELAARVARLYEKGTLVSIDKLRRMPPLDAPVDPRWFGEESELQRGNVVRRVSMRISVIDGKTNKEIEKHRQGLRGLLSKFTFPLADNMRWMPHGARRLFEAELERVNAEGQQLVTDLFKGDVTGFLKSKRGSLIADINAMCRQVGRQRDATEEEVERIISSLRERLEKARTVTFMPTLSYSVVGFSTTANTWASPWGQAYSFLTAIAEFPRAVVTDTFFLRGVKTPQDDLISAMDVAGDALLRDQAERGRTDRCKTELGLLKRIEKAPIESRERCDLVWSLIRGEKAEALSAKLDAKVKVAQ